MPDVLLPESNGTPAWLARLYENATIATWVGGYVDKAGSSLPTIDALAASPALSAAAVADFRAYAASSGLSIPTDSNADTRLNGALVASVAFVRYGSPGYYRLLALTDPAVKSATDAFAKSAILLPVK